MSEWELPSTVEEQSIERVGGGYAWESGVYDIATKLVYLDQAESGAVSFNFIVTNNEGKELKETLWIKSGNAKGNKTFYTGKDGIDRPLPGYAVANSMCVALAGISLAQAIAGAEKKTVNVYNAEQKKEVPTERPVLMPLLNKKGKVAVHQIKEAKQKKDESGKYVDTGDTRTVNESKFFGNSEGRTAEEITGDKPAEMFEKWAARNTGQVIDKTQKKDDNSSAADIMNSAGSGDASSTESMFS